ncbi:MAG TPA: DUF503 domain-containing protein [Desulfomonilia bacterium]|nr:DUF503 domain-containing protein [Desulfomonilia bacterium]
MVIGVCELRFKIIGAQSLKEKRKVLRSLKDRLMKMNVSVSEVDDNDKWQAATLGIAFVSNDSGFINSVIDKIIRGIEENSDVELLVTRTEIIHI